MTLSEAALSLGKNRNFFFVMRKNQPDRFAYLTSKNKNLVAAYNECELEIAGTLDKLEAIFYILEERRKQSKFSELAYLHGLYGSKLSLTNSLKKQIFMIRDNSINFKLYLKMKKLINLYEEHKDEILRK